MEGSRLIPTNWSFLAKTLLVPGEFLQFRTWRQDHAETNANHNRANNVPIALEQLMGVGPWGQVQQQMPMDDRAVEQLHRCCLCAWGKIESKSTANAS